MSIRIHNPGDTLIERYRVLQYVNEGGMQQVYLAKDLVFDREVALKVPKNPSAEKRFARSAQMSAKVVHANVAATLDYFECNSKSYLIEEFIEGHPLSSRLTDQYHLLDPHLASHLFHNLARGVAASHHVHVFHRDLKPSNVMVSGDLAMTTVKVTDFGIAKMAEEEISDAFKDEASTTGSQTVMGALPYMAPEMFTAESKGMPADIWALGAILFQMLTGSLPFGKGLTAVPKILEALVPKQPQIFAVKTQFSGLANELWLILTSCLQRDPSRRPTADELVALCSKLCYSDAARRDGTIDSFKDSRRGNWGYICTSNNQRIFFHVDSYYGPDPKKGTRVAFANFDGAPWTRAFPVLPLK